MTDRVWITDRSGQDNRRLYQRETSTQWIVHETWLPGARAVLFVDWPNGMKRVDVTTGHVTQQTSFPAWHAAADSVGQRLICDTNFPDIGLHLIDVAAPPDSQPTFIAWSHASSAGDHWAGPFPYNDGPVTVYAPQHTHPHPRFSPDGHRIVFTSDRSGHAQVYEILLDDDAAYVERFR
jgi:oligogalacturonide lyase